MSTHGFFLNSTKLENSAVVLDIGSDLDVGLGSCKGAPRVKMSGSVKFELHR